MRRALSLIFLAVGLMAVLRGAAVTLPARALADHTTPQPLSELLSLDDCHVVGNLNGGELLLECPAFPASEMKGATATPTATDTPLPSHTPSDVPATATVTQDATAVPSDTPAPTDTPTAIPSATVAPSLTPAPPTATAAPSTPYPAAPACIESSHDTSKFHTLWNGEQGCHYDHEHGSDPFTGNVNATFIGFDLRNLLGGVGIGHTNPSSPMENTHKHGGFKWNVNLAHIEGCAGFEGAPTGVNASAIQFHAFGNPAIENEARIHSTVALLRQCRTANPTDYGYVYIVQLQDYGQRIIPYQGAIVAYPNQPVPAFPSPRGPYWSNDCIDLLAPFVIQCRAGMAVAQANQSAATITSKVTGTGHSSTPALFRLLIRARDIYSLFDWSDQTHPFTFVFLCTSDAGLTYAPAGCRYTNTTARVHEVAGHIPAAWDNLAGWDTEPQAGRVTVEGYVNQLGQPAGVGACQAPGVDCYPIKLVRAFTGAYGSNLCPISKCSNTTAVTNPSRNVYFNAAGQLVAETAPGAVPSGWVGQEN